MNKTFFILLDRFLPKWYNKDRPILPSFGCNCLFCVLLDVCCWIGKGSQTMQIIIKGKQVEVTPRLRQIIERKVQRLARLVDDGTRVEVTVTEAQTRSARDRYSVQIALAYAAHPVRSEVSAVNANMALDLVLDKVITQLGRQKDRQTSRLRHRTPPMKVLSLSRSGSLSSIEDQEESPATESTESTGEQAKTSSSISGEQNEVI